MATALICLCGGAALLLLATAITGGLSHRAAKTLPPGRSLGGWVVGLSAVAAIVSADDMTRLASESYSLGLRWTLPILGAWLALPLVWAVVLPLQHRLAGRTVYEYLELRFSRSVRVVAALAISLWRLVWLALVTAALCGVASWILADAVPCLALIVGVAALGAACAEFGLRGVAWSAAVGWTIIVAAVAVAIGMVWSQLEGGPARVRQVAVGLDRGVFFDLSFSWSNPWSVWGAAPYWTLLFMTLLLADQTTAERFLASRSLSSARRAAALTCVGLTIVVGGLVYVGNGLLALYHDHPAMLQPHWVANVDPKTGRSATDPVTGAVLIPWGREEITAEKLQELVAEGRLLRPNRFPDAVESSAELIDPETGQLDVSRLASRRVRPLDSGLKKGEIVLHERAVEELFPAFIARADSPWLSAILVAGLLAAAVTSFSLSVHALAVVTVTDLAAGNSRDSPGGRESPHAPAAPWWVILAITVLAAMLGVGAELAPLPLATIVPITSAVGGPVLGLFMVGLLAERPNSLAALVGVALGLIVSIELALAAHVAELSWLWPLGGRLAVIWPFLFGAAATFLTGILAGWVVGKRRKRHELRGLVLGDGELGKTRAEPKTLFKPLLTDRVAITEEPPLSPEVIEPPESERGDRD